MYPIKQSTAITVPFFVHDASGDGVESLTDGSFTKRISKNGGAFGAMTVTISELENGWYTIPLGTGHSDTTGLLSITFTNAGAKQVNLQFRVDVRLPDDLAFPATTGRAVNVSAAGEVESDLQLWLGVAPLALSSQRVVVDVGAMQANVITAAAINAAAITNAKFANDAIDAGVVADGTIDAATFATGAIDAAAINADAVSKIRSIVTGTSEAGGSTTSLVDTALTEIDDTWIGCWILITSGTDQNRVRLITEFDAATDTLTFAPAVSSAQGAGITYEILPNAGVDLQSWLGAEGALIAPNALVSGAVDSDVSAMQADTITAAVIATAAIDADAFAAGAITATVIADNAITSAKFAAGAIDAAAIANGAIDAATFATGAIDANALAADALTAIEDEVWDALKSAHTTPNSFGDFLDTEVSGVGGIPAIVSGTSDSGSTTTVVDAVRGGDANDIYNGLAIKMTSGAVANQIRLITNFETTSGTFTFAPPLTASAGTETYEIIQNAPVDLQSWVGTAAELQAPNGLIAGAVDVDVSNIQNGVIDAAVIANGAIDAATFAAGAITSTVLADNAITAAKFAAGAIDASAIATGAIDADAFAANAITSTVVADNFLTAAKINAAAITAAKFGAGAITAAVIATGAIDADAIASDAVSKLRSIVTGTSDSGGSASTMIDAALAEADDLWTGNWILFTSGAIANQCRLITDFNAGSNTITFAPDVAASVGAGFTYEIIPYGGADVQSWIGLNSAMVSPNALASGRVDASVGAMVANIVNASALATDAVDEIVDAIFDEDIVAAHGSSDSAGLLLRALGALIAARSNNATLNALLGIGDSAGNDLPNELREAPQKNVAFSDIEFLMVASSDHVSPLTSLSPVATRSIDGGAFAATTGSVAEVGNGIYQFDASMADMNGDVITFRFAVATADDTFLTIKTKD